MNFKLEIYQYICEREKLNCCTEILTTRFVPTVAQHQAVIKLKFTTKIAIMKLMNVLYLGL